MTTPIVPSISDELIEELEAIQHDASFVTRETDSQEYLGNLAARTLACLRSAEADAKRYRWLRDVLRHDEKRWIGAGSWNHANIPPAEFDAAIDAAMERTP